MVHWPIDYRLDIPVLLKYTETRKNRNLNISVFVLRYKISREKFEPEPWFEPRTSGFLAQRSTTWAILVLMSAHVQTSLLRRMLLLPGGADMTLSVIILTTSEVSRGRFEHELVWEPRYLKWQSAGLEIRRSEVRIPVLVQIFLLRSYN